MNIQSSPRTEEFAFTDANFATLSSIARKRFGLDLQPSKKPLVYSRLAKRLRALGLQDFDAYCLTVEDTNETAEIAHLLSALTTNVTQFFREAHHFEFLANMLAPKLLARAEAGEPIRIWSAACSAGQEPYSIAASLLHAAPKLASCDLRILATDIDPNMINIAQTGHYSVDQKSAIPAKFHKIMLAPSDLGGSIGMSEQVRELISFAELNLIEPWPMRRPFDVVFCRNTTIYFDKATQRDVWQRFAKCLAIGGHLMIGHSERLSGDAKSQLQSVGITTYQKKHGNFISQAT